MRSEQARTVGVVMEDALSDQIDQALRDVAQLRGEVAAWSEDVSPLQLSGGGWAAA